MTDLLEQADQIIDLCADLDFGQRPDDLPYQFNCESFPFYYLKLRCALKMHLENSNNERSEEERNRVVLNLSLAKRALNLGEELFENKTGKKIPYNLPSAEVLKKYENVDLYITSQKPSDISNIYFIQALTHLCNYKKIRLESTAGIEIADQKTNDPYQSPIAELMAAQYCVHYGDINYIAYHGYLAFTKMENKFNDLKQKSENQQKGFNKKTEIQDQLRIWASEIASQEWKDDVHEAYRMGAMQNHVRTQLKRKVDKVYKDNPEMKALIKKNKYIPQTQRVMSNWIRHVAPEYAVKRGPTKK